VLALIWNHPELCSSFSDKALGILLEAIYEPWISWNSSVVRRTSWNFYQKRFSPGPIIPENISLNGRLQVGHLF
jgi:hypothetical protein